VLEADAERLRQLPGPEQSCSIALVPRRSRISSMPVERLERADQRRSADALRLGDGVQHRVDAVGAVDVGAPGGPNSVRVRVVSPANAWQAGSDSW
jgi:hypothetical protein